MFIDTLLFLKALYRDAQGWITFTAVHPIGKRPTPSRHIQTNDEGALHQALDDLQKANQTGWGAGSAAGKLTY